MLEKGRFILMREASVSFFHAFSVQESKMKSKMVYFCHIYVGTVSFSIFGRIQRRLRSLVEEHFCNFLSTENNVASQLMFFLYSPGSKSSDNLSVQTFAARTRNVTTTRSNRPHFCHVPNVWKSFYSEKFLSKFSTLENKHTRECFPGH